jgi:hypothetical protein
MNRKGQTLGVVGNPGDAEQRSGLIPNSVPVIANTVPI